MPTPTPNPTPRAATDSNGEPRRRILVIEDDRTTSETLRLYLEHAGFLVDQAFDGATGLDLATSRTPDLIVLDLLLPKLDGLAICRELRRGSQGASDLPILMLTARTAEDDRIRGLDLGADDYLVKPFSPRELVARVRAILRRSGGEGREVPQVVGPLTLDHAKYRATWNDQPLTLTPTELALLATLAARPGQVFTRRQLIEHALGYDFDGDDRTVDAHIKNLRRKVEALAPRLVHTVFGVGYRFALPASEEPGC